MAEGTTIVSPTIGAANSQLSQYVLDADDLITEVTSALQGRVKLILPNGDIKYAEVARDYKYDDSAIAWFQGKLRQILNRNVFLSRINTEAQMYGIQWSMSRMFLFEMFSKRRELNLNARMLIELNGIYLNYVDFATRRALYQSDKGFLTSTMSEQIQKISQAITSEQEKKGGFLGLFGGGNKMQ